MINNIELFELSLRHREPVIDPFYVKNGNIIISSNPKQHTDIMDKNIELIEAISAYRFADKRGDVKAAGEVLKTILKLIKFRNINYSEFVSFWPVVDVSFSVFQKLDSKQQLYFIKEIVDKYIKLRHLLYSSYGYTPVTLQVGKDAKAHKESGTLGINKVSTILNGVGYKQANHGSSIDFLSGEDKKYIESDKGGKKLFKDLLKECSIEFLWSKSKEQKMPDFLVRNKKDIFILEHKHMKESGGGQDKQMNEVISFIGFTDKNPKVHYVSFVDGIYFNLLASNTLKKGKTLTQLEKIKDNLNKNKKNYFVNTFGFKELI
ncbi:MAG: hypothetical protein M1153_01800 [Patescibacteria group bacterium]|nr:hypothetical protein [Patescibacteria group bacterium]